MTQSGQNALREFEVSLGLRDGFIADLQREDDWSFIIKAHALIEAGVSHLLAHELERPELLGVFGRLDMSATQFGKLAFAKALNIIDDRGRRFIRKLGEIRNDFVHEIGNAECRLQDYLARRDAKEIDAVHRCLDLVFDNPVEDLGAEIVDWGRLTPRVIFRSSPKITIAHSLTLVLTPIHTRTAMKKTSAAWRAHYASQVKGLTIGQMLSGPTEPAGPKVVIAPKDQQRTEADNG